MPLYDFRCRACGREFETLVRPQSTPECPECHGQDLERLPSTFAVKSSERTRAAADKNLKKHGELGWQKTREIEIAAKKHRDEDH